MPVVDLLQAYARRIRELRRANPDVPETALAPAFQQLLDGLIPLLPVVRGLVVSPEFRRAGVGRPDIALQRHTSRFAEDLEDVFPHIPFPAQATVFTDAARIGHEIRLIETFARDPGEAHRLAGFVRVETQPTGTVGAVAYADGAIVLCTNGSGRIAGIPQPVWDFAVSGYRVLPRWLEGRRGLLADFALVRELRDICGRIAELIDLFRQADTVLEATLIEMLTREALGFTTNQPEPDARPD